MADEGELRRVTSERDLAVERFVLMCKAMNQCMWDWDIRANVAWYSDAVYSVYGIDHAITPSFERWTTYVHREDRERVIAGFRSVVETGKAEWADEYRFVRPNDGQVLEVFDRGFVVFDDGRPVRMVGVVMDITQQRALERQLRHAQKMQAIGQLAGGIAHDFNNLLQAAKLELALLGAHPTASPEVLVHVKEVGTAIDRGASLTRQLLVFSRLEAMRVEAIDLNAKVSELTTMLRRLLGASIVLRVELTTDPVSIEADSSMVDQILVNLAINGRDAMADRGTLSIATSRCPHLERAGRRPGPYVCLQVGDTGGGIPDDILPRIFDPFFTTKSSGTGLGLATVYGIVEQHRGWIDVASDPGRGTTFRVYLPERDGDAPREAVRPAPRAQPHGREMILLVEDDASVRRALSSVLERHGYNVLTADSGAAALSAWDSAHGQIDLVVTDLLMPGMNGRELAAALAARRPELPILMISGHSGELEHDLTATQTLLHKPFEVPAFLDAVRARLDRT